MAHGDRRIRSALQQIRWSAVWASNNGGAIRRRHISGLRVTSSIGHNVPIILNQRVAGALLKAQDWQSWPDLPVLCHYHLRRTKEMKNGCREKNCIRRATCNGKQRRPEVRPLSSRGNGVTVWCFENMVSFHYIKLFLWVNNASSPPATNGYFYVIMIRPRRRWKDQKALPTQGRTSSAKEIWPRGRTSGTYWNTFSRIN